MLMYAVLLVFTMMDALPSDKRYVMLFTDRPDNPLFLQQQKALLAKQNDLTERDLVLKTYLFSAKTAAVFEKYNLKKDGFTMLLIGKDGGVKLTSTTFKKPEELFALIDGMPMRQSEMRRRNN